MHAYLRRKADAALNERTQALRNPFLLLMILLPPLAPLLRLLSYVVPTRGSRVLRQSRRLIQGQIEQWIRDARAELDAKAGAGAQGVAEPAGNGRREAPRPGSFLRSMLLHASDKSRGGAPLTEEQLTAQALTFLLGGYETSAATLSFALYLLARHPDKQERLWQEARALGDRDPTAEDSLPYVDAVVSEALRLYPPGVLLLRETQHATRLGGYTIPSKAVVAINIWNVRAVRMSTMPCLLSGSLGPRL